MSGARRLCGARRRPRRIRDPRPSAVRGPRIVLMLYRFNPLDDVRWQDFVDHHSRASVFHTRGWLAALRRTYGYQPIAFSSSPPHEALRDAVLFCEVRSWLTGRRLVSLPFSDHCEPLVDCDRLPAICAALQEERRTGGWRYLELRPSVKGIGAGESAFEPSEEFSLHLLDLQGSDDQLFRRFHRTATQQMIRRAERERLVCEEGRSEPLLRTFYSLLELTRRRHRIPPQPFAWFRNLASTLGNAMVVRVARAGTRPVAATVTLRHRDTMTFKYGASDAAFHKLGGIQLLLWNAIRDARAGGCSRLDLGRSDIDHVGLRTFKDRWGATSSSLVYWR